MTFESEFYSPMAVAVWDRMQNMVLWSILLKKFRCDSYSSQQNEQTANLQAHNKLERKGNNDFQY